MDATPQPSLAAPRCPVCNKALEAILRRTDFILLLCADCRISTTMSSADWDALPEADQNVITSRRSA